MATCSVNGNVVWGSTQVLTLNGEGWTEELNPQGHGFIMHSGSVFLYYGVKPGTTSEFFEEIWLMVECLSVWHIWTRRCKFVFQQQKTPSSEVLLNIWFELEAWLHGRYDSI